MEASTFVENLISIVGEYYVLTNTNDFYTYVTDHSTGTKGTPLCVVRPSSTAEISMIAKLCNEHTVGIAIRAGGSGVSGGFLSGNDSILISLDRLDRIIEINEIDRYIIAEAGVVTQNLQDALHNKGLCFPQNISSAKLSCIGGNVAVSSGSPKSLKYGSTKKYVLNLEVVLPNGEVIWTGKNIKKNATGYNLTQLFVGSEGTLGIITKVVLEIVPLKKEALILAPFKSSEEIFSFVKAFFMHGFDASSLEFLDKNAAELVFNYLNKKITEESIEGMIWVEFESSHEQENMVKMEALYELIKSYTPYEMLIGQNSKENEKLWRYRKKIGEAAINKGFFHDLDLVVQRSKGAEIYKKIEYVCNSLDLEFIVVGHIGDGNFHVNIFKDPNMSDDRWQANIELCVSTLLKETVKLGGEISGEHGIGSYNKTYFEEFTAEQNIKIMKGIKKVFDPKRLLNTNNIFIEKP